MTVRGLGAIRGAVSFVEHSNPLTAVAGLNLKPEGRGTRLVSEEVQQGPGPAMLKDLLNPALTATHMAWMDAIAKKLR